jgi:hypothetical protein
LGSSLLRVENNLSTNPPLDHEGGFFAAQMMWGEVGEEGKKLENSGVKRGKVV